MTFLQLVNAVLLRLREDSVTAVDDTSYTQLIAAFVNEAKEEVEDSWNWSHLRTNLDIDTTASITSYNLVGSNSRTRILDCYNTTKKWRLLQVKNNPYLNNQTNLSTVTGSANLFDITGSDTDTGEFTFRVFPTPTGTETLRFYCVVPQTELSDETDVLQIPSAPVIQLAYLKAINERGEDQGNLSATQLALYTKTLSSAISQDAEYYSDETTWQVI